MLIAFTALQYQRGRYWYVLGGVLPNHPSMFRTTIIIAWRNLLKDRQFSLLNLLGLSTGLACVLLIFFWVNDELQVDKFHAKDNRLYEVLKKGTDQSGGVRVAKNTQGMLAPSMAADLPELEYAVAVRKDNNASIVTTGEKHLKVKHQFAGKDFFKVFSYPLVDGRINTVAGVTGIFLSDQLAMKLFGTTAVAGKPVNWDYKDDDANFSGVYTVAGVYKAPPANASSQFDLLVPFELYAAKFAGTMGDVTFWGSNMVSTYVVLKEGVDAAAFNKKIKEYAIAKVASLYPGGDLAKYEGTLFIRRYSDAYLHNNFVNGEPSGGRIAYVKLFSLVAAFILVIACINFMNLSTAKASRRFKEIGIKKVVGASRRSLVVQYITESVLMAFASLLVALLLVQLMLPAFRSITGKNLQLPLNVGLLLSVTGIALLTGLIAGSYPALYLSKFKPVLILKGKTNTSGGEAWVRKGLVVFQFSVSVILIVSVMVIYQQMQLIQTINLGYNKDNIIRVSNDGNLASQQSSFLAALQTLPGVLHASGIDGDLMGQAGHSGGGISWEGKDPNLQLQYYGNGIDYDFLETMGIEVAEGRGFSKLFADSNSVLFNQAAIAAMGLQNPIGKMVSLWGKPKKIVGVVKDYHFESMYKKIAPSFFTFSGNNPTTLVKIKAGMEKPALAAIKKLFTDYNNGLAFSYTFLDEDYNALYASEQRVASLSGYFAGIAILISCLGLYGLAAFTAQKRQKEIGIRKVVGASVSNITAMLSGEFLRLVSVALLVAIPLSWWGAQQWLQQFAYRINVEPAVFVITAVVVLAITIVTISFQAVKAALANPVKTLRTE